MHWMECGGNIQCVIVECMLYTGYSESGQRRRAEGGREGAGALWAIAAENLEMNSRRGLNEQ